MKHIASLQLLIHTRGGNPADLYTIALNTRMAILTDAARIMFEQSGSGFIAQKEGAGSGSSDPYFQGILTDKLPK